MGEAMQAFLGPQHTLTRNCRSGHAQPRIPYTRHPNGESATGPRLLVLVPPLSRCILLRHQDEVSRHLR